MNTHILIDIKRVDRDTIATSGCGVVAKCRSRADAYTTMTAWPCLTTCPACRKRFDHPDA